MTSGAGFREGVPASFLSSEINKCQILENILLEYNHSIFAIWLIFVAG